MKKNLLAFLAGVIFSAGLVLGGMTRPSKVLGFLDVAGAWDASLALVMGGAVGLNVILFRIILRRKEPILGGIFHIPQRKDIDGRLVIGAAIFGVGWGIAGYCPGPGIVSLASGSAGAIVFVIAMAAGLAVPRLLESMRGSLPAEEDRSETA